MMIWMRLVESMISATGGGPPGGEDPGRTDLSANVVNYFFMVWISVILGGILLIEQYFGRRIHCFNPVSFVQPPHAIGEYCWAHGDFAKNSTESGLIEFALPDQGWLLQSYVYYFLRAFVFYLPHLLWNQNFRQWICAIIKGTEDLIKELEKLWLRYEDLADDDFNEFENLNSNDLKDKTVQERKQLQQKQIQTCYNAVMAMTRDVVQITKQQIPKYTSTLTFIQIRMVYDLVLMGFFVVFDLILFTTTNMYDSTDFYCVLPNHETIRCMVPMMNFQWHAALLSVICSLMVLAVTIVHCFSILSATCSSSTAGCVLEHIPFAGTVADLSWQSARHRRTYKVVSKFLMQNICILHPLNFMECFIQNMVENNQVPEFGQDITDVGSKNGGAGQVQVENLHLMMKDDGKLHDRIVQETDAL